MRLRYRLGSVVASVVCILVSACLVERPPLDTKQRVERTDAAASIDPLGPNAGCYVCHVLFVEEELAVTHQQAGVGCVRCHGPSLGHANDENIGATKPDVLIARKAINGFCRACHETHDVAPEKIVARWLERHPPAATSHSASQPASAKAPPAKIADVVCTACHGRHKINAE